tara:strand:+ start:362 stop:685 length:324 start_codon:yes stop_codon:yes gene_type:complete
MIIWVLSGSYEGEQFASSHLTEKGAILAAISDVLQLLGIEDEEDANRVMKDRLDGLMEDEKPIEWDLEKMRDMPRDKLWGIFGEWAEKTWDNSFGYRLEILKTKLEA